MDTVPLHPVSKPQQACNCLWAAPTLFLSAPYWFDSESCPWACLRDADPHVLITTDPCASCPRWERDGICHRQ